MSIEEKLRRAFAPAMLSIEDESARHAGHAGAVRADSGNPTASASGAGGETHFSVTIVSSSFAGLSRVERQRRIYAALKDEIAGGVHALALRALTPEETKA